MQPANAVRGSVEVFSLHCRFGALGAGVVVAAAAYGRPLCSPLPRATCTRTGKGDLRTPMMTPTAHTLKTIVLDSAEPPAFTSPVFFSCLSRYCQRGAFHIRLLMGCSTQNLTPRLTASRMRRTHLQAIHTRTNTQSRDTTVGAASSTKRYTT